MPIFNQYGPLSTQISPGSTISLFASTDTVTTGAISRVIAPVDSGPVARRSVLFTANGFGVTIYGSNTAPTTTPQGGVSVGTLASGASLQDTSGYAFYWAVASGNGPGTVLAHVS